MVNLSCQSNTYVHREVMDAAGCSSLELRDEVQTGSVNVGVSHVQIVSKAMMPDEITEGMKTEEVG